MSQDYCRGCGTLLQTLEPNEPGYIPENVMQERKQLTCQRCYRINHYGEAGKIQPSLNQIRQSIQKALNLSKVAVLVVDFSDLTGTFPVWEEYIGSKPYILAVNKIDLLPARTKPAEIIDYIKAYLKKWQFKSPKDIILVSGLRGTGIDNLVSKVTPLIRSDVKIALLGATNVGKSSLIKRILTAEGSPNTPTVSKFPGTTLGLSNWSILKGKATLIDTPGLAPGDRMGDLLCPKCSSHLAATRIQQKLWGIKPGKALILGGLASIHNISSAEATLIAFTPDDIYIHRTDSEKVKGILEEQPEWLNKFCKGCQQKLKWKEFKIILEPNQDIAIAGLGWVSLRGQATELLLTLPEKIRWEIRPAVVGKKG